MKRFFLFAATILLMANFSRAGAQTAPAWPMRWVEKPAPAADFYLRNEANTEDLVIPLPADSTAYQLPQPAWAVVPLDYQPPLDLVRNSGAAWGGMDAGHWLKQAFLTPPPVYQVWTETAPKAFPEYTPTKIGWKVGYYSVNRPIAHFGSSGQAPAEISRTLYVNKPYRFAIVAGSQTSSGAGLGEILIKIFNKNSGALVDQTTISLARILTLQNPPLNSSGWTSFGQDGYQKNVVSMVGSVPVLETKIQFAASSVDWAQWGADPSLFPNAVTYPYFLTHKALSADYGFVVYFKGPHIVGGQTVPSAYSISSGAWVPTHVPAYSMDFAPDPGWRTSLLTTPQFEGVAAPPAYVGKTVEEIVQQSVGSVPLPSMGIWRSLTGAIVAKNRGLYAIKDEPGTGNLSGLPVAVSRVMAGDGELSWMFGEDGTLGVKNIFPWSIIIYDAKGKRVVTVSAGQGRIFDLENTEIHRRYRLDGRPMRFVRKDGLAHFYYGHDLLYTFERKIAEEFRLVVIKGKTGIRAGRALVTETTWTGKFAEQEFSDEGLNGLSEEGVQEVALQDDQDNDGVSNDQELLDGTDPNDPSSFAKGIKWETRRNVSVPVDPPDALSGGVVGGADSSYALGSIPVHSIGGSVAFEFSSLKPCIVGLTDMAGPVTGYSDFRYGIQPYKGGDILDFMTMVNGVALAHPSVSSASTVRIEIEDDVVRFLADGNLIRTVSRVDQKPLWPQVFLFTAGTSIAKSRIFSRGDLDQDQLPDEWETSVDGGEVELTSSRTILKDLTAFAPEGNADGEGTEGDGNATNLDEYLMGTRPWRRFEGKMTPLALSNSSPTTAWQAVGESKILKDGALFFTYNGLTANSTQAALGLNVFDAATSAADIDFSVLFERDSAGKVRAFAAYQGERRNLSGSAAGVTATAAGLGTVDPGDRFGLVRTAGEVTIWKNGTPVHTFLEKEHEKVIVDSFFSANVADTAFSEVRYCAGDSDGDGMLDKWELEKLGLPVADLDDESLENLLAGFNATDDYDSDTVANRQEYWDGTNPTDPFDHLRKVVWTRLRDTEVVSNYTSYDNVTGEGVTVAPGEAGENVDMLRVVGTPVEAVNAAAADARSSVAIYGDGWFSFSFGQPDRKVAAGLTVMNDKTDITDLRYGFLSTGTLRTATDTTNDGTLRLIYNGAEVATATYEGAFDASTRLCLQIVGSEVRYYVDDTVVYAVSHDPSLPVWADTSFYVTGTSTAKTTGSILNARLKSSGDIDADLMPDAWEISEEGGDLKPADNSPVTVAMLEAFKPEEDDDIVKSGNPPVIGAEDGSSNLLEFAAGSHAGTPFLGKATPVTWRNPMIGTGFIAVNQSRIENITNANGGTSFTTFTETTIQNDESIWFGFGNVVPNTYLGLNFENIGYAVPGGFRWISPYGIFVSNGEAYIFENTTYDPDTPPDLSDRRRLGACTPYDPVTKTGTRFGIVRKHGQTTLWKDGIQQYTFPSRDTSRYKVSVELPYQGIVSECLIVRTDNAENPEDSLPDRWELAQQGVDPRMATQALINAIDATKVESGVSDGQSASLEFLQGTNPLDPVSRATAIVWTLLDDVEPFPTSGLRKTSANGWNASARSTVAIGTGNKAWDEDSDGKPVVKGSVIFEVSRLDKDVKFGLTSALNLGGSGETHEFYLVKDGALKILDKDATGVVTTTDFGGYSNVMSWEPLRLRVDVEGNKIHYFRDGVRVYTVTRSSSEPLWAKAELFHLDASGDNSLGNCYIYSSTDEDADGMADAWEGGNITDMPDRESAADSYWTKLDAFKPAGDGDGDSTLHYQEFASRTNPASSISGKAEPVAWTSTTVVNGTKKVNGNGAVWFKASQTVANQKDFAIGFSRESAANTLADVQFALRWVPVASSGGKGTVSVYSKSGTALATLGRFPMTTEMGLVRSGGVVTVWMDGAPVYAFANEESAPVFVDGYVASSTLQALAAKPYEAVNIVTGDSDGDGLPDEWELANGGLALASDGSTPAPGKDTDGDGRSDIDEYRQGTAPAEDKDNYNLALSYATPVQWTRVAGPATSLDLSLAVGAVDKAANQSKVIVTTASARIFRVGDTVTMAFSGAADTGAFVSGTFKVTEATTTTFSYVDGLTHATVKSNTVVVPLSVITPGKIYSVVAAASDAQSTIPLETEGSFSFRPGQSNERFVVGLTEDNVTATEADILYGFSPEANGTLKLRQPGATPLLTGSWNYTSDSWLRLDVDEKEVRYLKDGYVIHRVERVAPSKPLWVDAWFTAGATTGPIVLAEAWLYSKADSDADGLPDGKEPRWEVANLAPDASKSLMTRLREYSPTADSDLQPSNATLDGSSNRSEFVTGTNASDRLRGKAIPVTWSPAQSPVLPQGGLAATLTTAWTVDAVSEQSLIQDGSVWFRFGDASEKALGLTVADTGKALTDIDYGVKLLTNGEAWAYYRDEATTRAQFLGKPAVGAAGTLFGIVRREGKVSVWVEGTRLYAFPQTETAPLKVDTAFKATGSIIECKVISGAGDEDADGLLDSWELAQLNDPAQPIDSFGPSGDFDEDGRTNQEEFDHGTDSTSGGDEHFARPVKWVRARGLTVPTSATGALSSSGTGQDAQSHIAVEKDGVFSFRFGQNNLAAASGLNSVNAAATLADLDYAFEVTTTKDWYVVRDGKRVSPAVTGKYDANTWFRIESNGDEIRYYANNVLVHTVTRTKVVALLADVYLGATGTSITQAWIYSAEDLDADGLPDAWEKETMGTADAPLAKLTESFQPGPAADGPDEGTQPDGDWDNDGTDNRVEFAMGTNSGQASLGQLGTVGTVIADGSPIVWTPLTAGTFAITGDQLQKTSATVTSANSATLSANGVLRGDCAVWFRVSSAGKKLVAGLKNHTGTDAAGINDVDFGIYFDASSIAHAYYRGGAAETASAVHLGVNVADVTVWGVVRRAGKITLWKDGLLVYSFLQREASALTVDTGFLDQGATISSCRIWRSDSDGDLLADAWEWKHFATLAQNASGDEPAQAGESPEGRSNLDEFRDGTSPADKSSHSVPMVWNRLRLVTVDSGDSSSYQGALTAAAGSYGSDAQSSAPITDHGAVSFKMKAKALAAIGFNDSNKAPVLADLNYAFHPQADGSLKIIEPGVVPWSLGTYTAETWFRLEATSAYVQYFMDGIMVHECKRSDPAAKLWVDTAFSASGAGIDVCRIFAPDEPAAPKNSAPTAFTWTATGAVTPGAGTDSGASVSWSGAGQLTSGDRRILKDGGVWFKIPSSGKAILAGLNVNDGATTAADIDYGVWVDANDKAWAYRNGANAVGTSSQAAYLGTNNPGVTEYGVVRNEGRITIWGSAFDPVSSQTVYTQLFEFDESELAPLFVDVSSAVSGAMISSCEIMHGRGDVDGDQMDDDWENQYFGSYVNNTSSGHGIPSQDADGDGVSNLQEFLDGTNPRDAFSRTAPLVWVRHRGTQSLGGTSGGLVKESAQAGGWNADAQSSIAIADSGSFSFRPETGTLELMAGLTFANSLSSNVDLEYYVLLKTDGKAYFKHPGSTRLTSLGKYYPGTLFRLDVDADSVSCSKDGILGASGVRSSPAPLWADVSLKTVNAKLISGRLFSAADVDADGMLDEWERGINGANWGIPVTYAMLNSWFTASSMTDGNGDSFPDGDWDSDGGTNLQEFAISAKARDNGAGKGGKTPVSWISSNASSLAGSGSSLEHVTSVYSSSAVDAVSSQTLDGDGAVWFTLGDPAVHPKMMIGLNAVDASRKMNDIDYAVYVEGGNAWACHRVEVTATPSKESAAFLGKYNSSTLFGIVRVKGLVSVWKDGTPLYQFPAGETAVLKVDTAFPVAKGRVEECYITRATAISNPAQPAGWTDQPVLWSRLRGKAVPAGPSQLSRSDLADKWNSDAQSHIAIAADEEGGRASFRLEPSSAVAIGLTELNQGTGIASLNFGFLSVPATTTAPASFKLIHGGKELASYGTFEAGTVFGLWVTEDEVRYVRDGYVFFVASRFKEDGPAINVPLWLYASVKKVAKGVPAAVLEAGIFSPQDRDADGLADIWENYTGSGTGLAKDVDTDSDGGLNWQEFAQGSLPSNPPDPRAPYSGSVIALGEIENDDILINSAIVESKSVTSAHEIWGDGAVWFKSNGSSGTLNVGLSLIPVSGNSKSVDFGVCLTSKTKTASACYKGETSPTAEKFLGGYDSATVFGIVRRAGKVTVWKDSVPLYEFPQLESAALRILAVDSKNLSNGLAVAEWLSSTLVDSDGDRLPDNWELAQTSVANLSVLGNPVDPDADDDGIDDITEFRLGSDPRNADIKPVPVLWTRHRFTAPLTSGGLRKTLNLSGWNADAQGGLRLSGSGAVHFVFGGASFSKGRALGLNVANQDASLKDLDYAVCADDGSVSIREKGVMVKTLGTASPSDEFLIRLDDGVISYWQNGARIYTSPVRLDSKMLIDASLEQEGDADASIASCYFFGAETETGPALGGVPNAEEDWYRVDDSPELFAHPLLDSFVNDMQRNPLRIANWVLNEIELVDAVALNENGIPVEKVLNDGGVARGALGVFLERQGSPKEQCALLVYLLRRAGYPAGYIFPQTGTTYLPARTVSSLLRMQVRGTLAGTGGASEDGQVAVNYPWVVCNLGGEWVSIYPWLKDVEIKEGLDLWDHMPQGKHLAGGTALPESQKIDSPLRWVRAYLKRQQLDAGNYADSAYDELASKEAPLETFERKLPLYLAANPASSSLHADRFGYSHRIRKHSYARWDQLPKPGHVFETQEGEITVRRYPRVVMKLADEGALFDEVDISITGEMAPGAALTNSAVSQMQTLESGLSRLFFSAGVSGLVVGDYLAQFDSGGAEIGGGNIRGKVVSVGAKGLSVDVEMGGTAQFQTGQPLKKVARMLREIGPLRLADMHNRQAVIQSDASGISVKMAAYRNGVSGTGNFVYGTKDPFGLAAQAVQVKDVQSGSFGVQITLRSSRHISASSAEEPFLQVQQMQTSSQTLGHGRGDVSALCFNLGRVTQQMMRVHEENYWRAQQQKTLTDASSREMIAYTMGMTYHQRFSESLDRIMHLFKLSPATFRAFGFGQLGFNSESGKRDLPIIDMAYSRTAVAGVWDLRPDSGGRSRMVAAEALAFISIEQSALEHLTINRFFPQEETDAISTINLLHRRAATETNPPPYVELSLGNYQERGEVNYTVGGQTQKLKEWSPPQWKEVESAMTQSAFGDARFVQVFMTPGPQTGAASEWKGMGTLILGQGATAALIGQTRNLNGGYGAPPLGASTTPHLGTISITPDGHLSFINPASAPIGSNPGAGYNSGAIPVQQVAQALLSISSGIIGYTPADRQTQEQAAGTPGGITNGTQYAMAGRDRANYGSVSPANVVNPETHLADPVDSMTGAFYIDTVDLALPGSFPLEIRRNYSSLNQQDGMFGYGWMSSLMPFIVVNPDNSLLAAEMDGTVLKYTPVSGQPNQWEVTWAANPELRNAPERGLKHHKISKSGPANNTVYRLVTRSGSVREFKVRSFPISGTTITRQRPYLSKWTDHAGNYYEFVYYDTDPKASEYGQLKSIRSSSGPYVLFYYNASGRITEVLAGDGRRVEYRYNQYGDLAQVVRADNSMLRYVYGTKTEADSKGVVRTFSDHLIMSEHFPEGRVVANEYDDKRRVTVQKSTAGKKHPGARLAPVVLHGKSQPFINAEDAHLPVTESYDLVLTAVFDYSGQAKVDADGTANPASGIYISGTTKVYDAYGRPITYAYDRSRLVRMSDQMGITETWEYHFDTAEPGALNFYPRSLKRSTNRRGLVTELKYDAEGNITTTTLKGDIDGDGQEDDSFVTSTAYNPRQLPVSMTVSAETGLGSEVIKVSEIQYLDPVFPYLPSKTISWVAGVAVSETENVYGIAGDGVTAPFARGVLVETRTGSSGDGKSRKTFTYDARGLKTSETAFSGIEGVPDVTLRSAYNDRHELVGTTDAAGRMARYAYDDMGRKMWEERLDESGKQLGWTYTYYNLNGEVEWTDGSRSNPEDYSYVRYDGMGRPVEQTSWRSQAKEDGSGVEAVPGADLYAVVTNEYNVFGDLVRSTDALGHITNMTYDRAGRLLTKELYDPAAAAAGSVQARETTVYTPVDFVLNGQTYQREGSVSSTNVVGGTTITQFASTGKSRSQTRPDGTTVQWTYYLDGRPKTEPKSKGVYTEFVYDDAARKISTQIKASGVSAGPAPSVAVSNSRGQVFYARDSAGYAVRTVYDFAGRPLKVSQPHPDNPLADFDSLPLASVHTYDEAGIFTVVANGAGEVTSTKNDALGRPVLTQVFGPAAAPGGAAVLRRQTEIEYSFDHNRVTTRQGLPSDASRQQTSVFTDTAGRTLITQSADGTRSITKYDAVGNASENCIKGGAGLPVNGLKTAMAYDRMNRVISVVKPDGTAVLSRYSYPAGGGAYVASVMPGNEPGKTVVEYSTSDSAGRPLATRLLEVSRSAAEAANPWAAFSSASAKRSRSYAYESSVSAHDQGQLRSLSLSMGGSTRTQTYEYDAFLRSQAVTISSTASTPDSSADYVRREFVYETRSAGASIIDSGRNLVTSLTEITNDPSADSWPELRSVTVSRSYDSHGRIITEKTTGTGLTGHTWVNAYDPGTLRRSSLSYLTGSAPDPLADFPRYDFGWHAEGNLKQVSFTSHSGASAREFIYGFDMKGQITSRTSPWRNYAVTGRDTKGRLTAANTQIPGLPGTEPELAEALTWLPDNRQDKYTAARAQVGVNHSLPEDVRDYAYHTHSRRLTSEADLSGNGMGYAYDASGRGILNSIHRLPVPSTPGDDFLSTVPSGGVDAFSRVTGEVTNDSRRYLLAEGAADPVVTKLSARLFDEVPVRSASLDAVADEWKAPLFLRPSSSPYQLRVDAEDDSVPPFQVTASSTFAIARRAQTDVTLTHDDEGQVTERSWSDGRAQSLSWDAVGRLIQVIEFKVPAIGDTEPSYAYRWTALHDGLGRRVKTLTEWGSVTTSGSMTVSARAATFAVGNRPEVREESWYDPLVEFLELAVRTTVAAQPAGKLEWKVYGADANGAYGGLQGIGGLEAVYTCSTASFSTGAWTGIIDDYYGHVVAYVEGDTATSSTLHWHHTRSIGYGPDANSPVFHMSEGASLVQATAWRGKRQDITGFYWLGARYYEPTGGRFLSPDPAGHSASMSLYDYAGGDPINFVDPTGRVQKPIHERGSYIYSMKASEAALKNEFAGMFYYMAKSAWAGLNPFSKDSDLRITARLTSAGLVQVNNGIGDMVDSGKLPWAVGAVGRFGTIVGGTAASLTLGLANYGEAADHYGTINPLSVLGSGLADYGGLVKQRGQQFLGNPSWKEGFNLVEDATNITLIAKGALSLTNAAQKLSFGSLPDVQLGGTKAYSSILPGIDDSGRMVGPATKSGPGQFGRVIESMSDRAAIYQSRVTGRLPDVGYTVNGVKFDGFDTARGVLLDAKGPGYATFVRDGQFRPWYNGADSMAAQAQRQLGAAGGTPIEWHFAEEAAANATRNLFQSRGIEGILIFHTP